ncbi:hypothetical protein EI53_01221 [Fusobacterium naviforme]|nr:hypothetical protein EI53_01221 [Fusobacterium naviforme]STO27569.1 Uncharacterised protein [Fusobacterium naviforme]
MINREKVKELDSHWKEVMDMAEQYGFITQAYGGVAQLVSHRRQIEAFGEEEYAGRLKEAFGIDMEVEK